MLIHRKVMGRVINLTNTNFPTRDFHAEVLIVILSLDIYDDVILVFKNVIFISRHLRNVSVETHLS